MPNIEVLETEEHKLQEAHFHHCLFDFKELVRQHAIELVMECIDPETYWILHKWYTRGDM